MIAVHNLMEVKALIKEAFQSGDEFNFDGKKWAKHDGSFLCTSFVFDTEFELVVEDTDELQGYRSVLCEVL